MTESLTMYCFAIACPLVFAQTAHPVSAHTRLRSSGESRAERKVTLFNLAGLPVTLTVADSEYGRDDLGRRASTGYILYADGFEREAGECFESLLSTERRPEAAFMCGVVAANEGEYARAESLLEEAIRLGHEIPGWTDPGTPRKALIWMHCEKGDLEAAERLAAELTRLPGTRHERAWHILADVRRQRRNQRLLERITPWLTAFPLGIGLGILFWRKRRKLTAQRGLPYARSSQLWTNFNRDWSQRRF